MNRMFGSANKAPTQSIEQNIATLEANVGSWEVKIKAKNAELMELSAQKQSKRTKVALDLHMAKMRAVLKKRKEFEQEQAQQQAQLDNLLRAQNMQSNLKNSLVLVDTMKATQKEMKKQFNKFDLDKIERMNDDMAELIDLGNEIQESLSRTLGNPEDVDESELDAELDAIGDEVEFELEMQRTSAMPGFLEDEVPDFIDEAPKSEANKLQEVAR